MRIHLNLFSATAICTSLTLCALPCIAQSPESPTQKTLSQQASEPQAVIRVQSLLIQGEFDVMTESVKNSDMIRVTLEGKMWDEESEGEGIPKDSWSSKLIFVFNNESSNINTLKSLRTFQSNGTTVLYSAEPLSPNAEIWTQKTAPSLGNMEVWKDDSVESQITDSVLISLFQTLIAPLPADHDGQRGTPCNPNYGECLNAAKNACSHGIASFQYECDQGAVVCQWACHPAPEPAPE